VITRVVNALPFGIFFIHPKCRIENPAG
jgi:hypothetical protein